MTHQHRHVHLHEHNKRNAWEDFTSKVGEAFGGGNKATPTPQRGQQQQQQPTTIHRTVFMTMSGNPPDNSPGQTLQSVGQPLQTAPPQIDTESAPQPTLDSLPPSIAVTVPTGDVTDLPVATETPTQPTRSAAPITAAPSPSATSAPESSGGDNVAVKAGITVGILAGLFAIFVVIMLVLRRRRKQKEQQRLDDDEKLNGPFGSAAAIGRSASTKTLPKAPRLSLRPVTQFLPNLNPHPHPDRRTSRGAAIAMVPSPTMNRPTGASPWERRPSTSASNHPANPFGDNAERMRTPTGHEHDPVSPLSDAGDVGTAMATNSSSNATTGAIAGVVAGIAASAAGGAAAGGLIRKASIRKDAPKALDLTIPPPLSTVPPSPAGTEFSMHSVAPGQSPGPSTSAAAIAAAGGPQASTVHRVQLDFKPTMEDEMGLRAGQLVRLLHEYDDGWALCIRLDRSQQGVVPRTCLSTRPVKPRPGPGGQRPGPPVNPQQGYGRRGPNFPPGQRPMTPQGGPGYPRPQSPSRPMTAPGSGQPQSPAPHGRPMSPYGARPASPAQGRPMSPGPRAQSPGPRFQQQGRSQSPSGMNRRMSPPGPSHMNQQQYPPGPPSGPPSGPIGRKPVPGQAY